MPTVNAIAGQVELTADVSSKLFRNDFHKSANSILIKGSLDTAANLMSEKGLFAPLAEEKIFGLRSNISEMLDNYAEERKNFNAKFNETMSSLKQSAAELESTPKSEDTDGNLSRLGDFATFKIPPEAMVKNRERERLQREDARQLADMHRQQIRDDSEKILRPEKNFKDFAEEYLTADKPARVEVSETNQNTNSTREENISAALSNVKNFVNTFNSTVDYLNENRGMSSRMNALAANFGDNKNLTQSLDSVGISVNESGKLRVNEDRLADALDENSSNVNAVLGQNGLAGRMSRNVDLANSQRENFFPTVTDYAGEKRDEPTESLYAAQNNQTAAHAKENAGHFLNMFT